MTAARFTIGCLIWIAVMALMATMGPAGKTPLAFGGLYLVAFAAMLYLTQRFPRDLRPLQALGMVLLLGLTVRLFFLKFPVGNDIYRYVWEGHIQNLGFNPYRLAPDHPALIDAAAQNMALVWKQINHKEYAAIYPPFSQLLFQLLAAIRPDPYFFKCVFWGFDLGVMIVAAKMLIARNLPPKRLLLYAANPLVIVFIAGEGHLDGVQIFFLLLGLHLIETRKTLIGFISIGLAVMTKYTAVVALPFLVTRDNWKQSLACLIPAGLYLPYIEVDLNLFHALGTFAADLHYNDSVTAIIRFFFSPPSAAWISMLILGGCLLWIFLFVSSPERSVYLGLGCLLVCLPTLHPWYLALISPFLLFYPSRAWLALQAGVVFTLPVLALEYRTGIFQEINWLKILEYGPFYGLLLYGLFRNGWMGCDRTFSAPRTVSVVIPTLNEAENIDRCLAILKLRPAVSEILVADGGSTDATVEIAREKGAIVCMAKKGRGLQIKRGIESSSGDLVVVLHADCLPVEGFFSTIINTMIHQPSAVGGAVGMRFEDRHLRYRWIAFLNNLRARITGIAFGDQAQFFRRAVLRTVGGFPEMMLMEDVELSLRLKEVGPVLFIPGGVCVSSRRWHGKRFVCNFLTVLRLFFCFLIARRFTPLEQLGRKYYRRYYRDR